MKYEITAEQLTEIVNIFGSLPYKIIKPYEVQVSDLIKKIESQIIKEELKEK